MQNSTARTPDNCWVEQVAEHPDRNTGRCTPGCTSGGEVLGRGPDALYTRFAGEGQLLSVSPAFVHLLPDAPGGD
jgi:hypothetical protein